MNRMMLRKHSTAISILIFIALYGGLMFVKPAIIFNSDGSLRDFGVGYHRRTIFPAWLIAIVCAILSYLGVLMYLAR